MTRQNTSILSDQHIHRFQTEGYAILEAALPSSLIGDLRRAAETGVKLARERHGNQIQVVQPIARYPEMDQQPFRDYAELPALNEAVRALLTPAHDYGRLDYSGLLIEPADHPWCCPWHRDWRDHIPAGVFDREYRDEWEVQTQDYRVWFAQINCALYRDASTWYVPGSVYRMNATEKEIELIGHPGEDLQQLDDEPQFDAERRLLRYCREMPGAIQIHLEPGDFCIYRSNALHLGNYSPDVKRVTIHDGAMNEEVRTWWKNAHRREEERGKIATA